MKEERRQRARQDRDLLEEMQGIIDRLRESGTEVAFWYIRPRALEAARKAAYREPDICTEEFTRFCEIDLDIW